jgi:isocitrate/isopropylmalate dehydrogenase
MYRVLLLPGDGVGPESMEQAKKYSLLLNKASAADLSCPAL